MAPLAATSPEATKVLFEGLPFRLNEPLPLRMRGKMGPKCPLAANKPMLVMIVKRSWNWVWLPTYLQVLFLDYLTGVCLNFIHHRIHGLPVLSSWYLEADSRIFAALHLWPQPGDDIQINGSFCTDSLPIMSDINIYKWIDKPTICMYELHLCTTEQPFLYICIKVITWIWSTRVYLSWLRIRARPSPTEAIREAQRPILPKLEWVSRLYLVTIMSFSLRKKPAACESRGLGWMKWMEVLNLTIKTLPKALRTQALTTLTSSFGLVW